MYYMIRVTDDTSCDAQNGSISGLRSYLSSAPDRSVDLLFHNISVVKSFGKVTAIKADTITLDLTVTLSVQHYYSVRIFPGQEPSSVWVGWVTSDFHQYDPSFELHNVRTVTVTLGDEKGKVHER